MADAQSILTPLKMPDSVKADAWDAYQHATSTDDLTARLRKLPLPDSVRADLWDAKNAAAPVAATPDAPRSFARSVLAAPAELLGGIGAGVISTGVGAYDLARKIPGAANVLPEPSPTVRALTQAPPTVAGKTGKFLEQGAEFLLPMGAVGDAVKGTDLALAAGKAGSSLGTRAAATGLKLGAEAATAGATAGVQTGGNVPAMVETAATTGLLGGAGAALPTVGRSIGVPMLQKVIDASPRPLSAGAEAMAAKLGIPLTRGMQGGSRTVQAAEKLLGHSVAPDLYEPVIEQAQQGLNRGAKDLSGGFATDRFTAGENTAKTMLTEAKGHEAAAQQEYQNLAQLEKDPANVKSVQVGTKPNPDQSAWLDPASTAPKTVPAMQDMGLPVDMRPTKDALRPLEDEITRRMTPAQRRADPGLAAIQNILSRPDALPASVAEADLSYLKEIMRSGASGQAKRLAGAAIDSLDQQVQTAVSAAGPDAVQSLATARASWKSRSEILDTVKSLTGDLSGQKGQVMLANKLLQPSDASFPVLQKVLAVAPDAGDDIGKAFLTERVFRKTAAGADFTNPTEASNLWNQMGPRTKAALYTPDQIGDINDFLTLAKRVAENPNPSGTGTMNMLIKMGVMITHPGAGAGAFVLGRNIAKVLYAPEGAEALKIALQSPESPKAAKAMLLVKSIMAESETAPATP